MRAFTYERVTDARAAVAAASRPGATFISGGTNLLDLMKLEIERPSHLVDISRLPLRDIEELPDGGLRIGAQAANSDAAADTRVRTRYPVLSQALLAGASGQLRNKASVGGNLLQRTRCPYFYDTAAACNKRDPGSGCSAIGGFNRIHAILGASDACIATHPSDMAVAMAALDARDRAAGRRRFAPPRGHRRLPSAARRHAAHRDRAATRRDDHGVVLPPPPPGRQLYRKVRDRASYEFALVSVAAIVATEQATISGGAGGVRRRGAQAVAVARGGGRAGRAPGHDGDLSRRRRGGAARRGGPRPQRLQDRTGEAHAVPHAGARDRGGLRRHDDDRTTHSTASTARSRSPAGPPTPTSTGTRGQPLYGFIVGATIGKGRITRDRHRSGRSARPACAW